MSFFQNTCKPKGIGGKIMVNMMNSGHSSMAEWGFTHIEIAENNICLDIGCGGGANAGLDRHGKRAVGGGLDKGPHIVLVVRHTLYGDEDHLGGRGHLAADHEGIGSVQGGLKPL